jgi:MoaA/NifB/PqqE/SkfB family radical SAM enzyme
MQDAKGGIEGWGPVKGSDGMTLGNLLRAPLYLARGLKYHAAGRLYTPKPLCISVRVTRRCNSRCIMCSDWKGEGNHRELTLAEIKAVFSSPLFDSVEKLALGGGEPTLREDVAKIAEVVLDSMPKLKSMSLLTNGLEPAVVESTVRELLALPGLRGLETFAVSVSLDGCGDMCESIRRVPRAFERVKETVERLRLLQRQTPFYLCSTCVVQPLNVGGLVELWECCQEMGVPLVFSPVCISNAFIDDADSRQALRLNEEQLDEMSVVFERDLESRLMPSNLPFWREYFKMARGGRRSIPCYLCRHGATLDSDGTLCLCSADASLVYGSVLETPPDRLWYSDEARALRRRVERDYCPTCTICCDMAFCLRQEFFYYAGFLLKERTGEMLGRRSNAGF